LQAVADEAPHDLGLLSRVQVRSRRRARVRRIGALSGVAAAVALVVAGVTLLPGGARSSVRYTTPPDEFFMSGKALDLRFPWVVQGLPNGLTQDEVVLGRTVDTTSATWTRGGSGGEVALSITTGPRDLHGMLDQPTKVTAVTVRNHDDGRLACRPGTCELSWQERPGEWLDVYRDLGTAADASIPTLTVAAHLVRHEVVRHQALVMGAVPVGCRIGFVDAHSTLLTGSGVCERAAAVVYTGTIPTNLHGKAVDIAGHQGILLTQRGVLGNASDQKAFRAELHLDRGRVLEVLVPADHGWNEQLLRYFVEHLTLPA